MMEHNISMAEVAANQSNSSALVLMKTAVDNKVGEVHPRLRRSARNIHVDPHSYNKGIKDARNVDMGQHKMNRGGYALTA